MAGFFLPHCVLSCAAASMTPPSITLIGRLTVAAMLALLVALLTPTDKSGSTGPHPRHLRRGEQALVDGRGHMIQ